MKQRNNKLIALAAAVVMTVGAFTSCASGDNATADNKADSLPAVTEAESRITAPQTTDKTFDAPEEKADATMTPSDMPETAGKEYARKMETNDAALSCEAAPDGAFYSGEEYKGFAENQFTLVSESPLSTFSTDVDTASYSNTRRFLSEGLLPDKDSVRAEEFINYFSYDYPQPTGDDPISITTELADGSFLNGSKTKLLMVGLKARDIEVKNRPPMNIVLLIDVSGSMKSSLKLPLAVKAFKMLSESLTQNDRVSIVTYSGEEKIVLDGANGSDKGLIAAALDSLVASGATAGEAGINMAYDLAEKYFIKGGNNRIVMATDGDLNVGVSSEEELKELVEKKRESGVFLSVLGFGTGNLKDARLEALADNGNGNYSYIDSEQEAEKVLSAELSGTLFTVAKDVKAQIEFDPKAVAAYKLVGYENRALSDEDFTDDTKDAGDMGAGHQVTIIYEIVPANGVLGSDGICGVPLSYTPAAAPAQTPETFATVRIRYKEPEGDTGKELTRTVKTGDYNAEPGDDLAFACCVAGFAKYLRRSDTAPSLSVLLGTLNSRSLLTDNYRQQFAELIKIAAELSADDPQGRDNGQ